MRKGELVFGRFVFSRLNQETVYEVPAAKRFGDLASGNQLSRYCGGVGVNQICSPGFIFSVVCTQAATLFLYIKNSVAVSSVVYYKYSIMCNTSIDNVRHVLPTNVRPNHYDLSLTPDLINFTYTGEVNVQYVPYLFNSTEFFECYMLIPV